MEPYIQRYPLSGPCVAGGRGRAAWHRRPRDGQKAKEARQPPAKNFKWGKRVIGVREREAHGDSR
ncbi:MAG: hypothetical protein ACPIOQ_34165 [Promethearchaeia archaeon]